MCTKNAENQITASFKGYTSESFRAYDTGVIPARGTNSMIQEMINTGANLAGTSKAPEQKTTSSVDKVINMKFIDMWSRQALHIKDVWNFGISDTRGKTLWNVKKIPNRGAKAKMLVSGLAEK